MSEDARNIAVGNLPLLDLISKRQQVSRNGLVSIRSSRIEAAFSAANLIEKQQSIQYQVGLLAALAI